MKMTYYCCLGMVALSSMLVGMYLTARLVSGWGQVQVGHQTYAAIVYALFVGATLALWVPFFTHRLRRDKITYIVMAALAVGWVPLVGVLSLSFGL